MKPDIDYDMIRCGPAANGLSEIVAMLFQTGMYRDQDSTKRFVANLGITNKHTKSVIRDCSMLVIELQKLGVIGCNRTISYGHQLLDELIACQTVHRVGLAHLRKGIEATFTAAAKEEKGDDWQAAVLHSLECLLAAGLAESARQLELRRN